MINLWLNTNLATQIKDPCRYESHSMGYCGSSKLYLSVCVCVAYYSRRLFPHIYINARAACSLMTHVKSILAALILVLQYIIVDHFWCLPPAFGHPIDFTRLLSILYSWCSQFNQIPILLALKFAQVMINSIAIERPWKTSGKKNWVFAYETNGNADKH